MGGTSRIGFVEIFRLRAFWGAIAVGAGLLAGFGRWGPACGLAIGGALFTLNSFFIYEAGRSLLSRGNRARGGFIAGIAPLGRFAFLGVGLAGTAALGQEALFSAMGGVMLGQVLIHLGHLRRGKVAGCPNT